MNRFWAMAKNKHYLNGVGRQMSKAPITISKRRMKRVGNLYEQICSLDNLRLADEKARRYRFYHTHTLLRKSIKRKFCRRVAKLRKKKHVKYEHFKQQICSWWGWCKYCDSNNFMNKILKDLPYEIKFKR